MTKHTNTTRKRIIVRHVCSKKHRNECMRRTTVAEQPVCFRIASDKTNMKITAKQIKRNMSSSAWININAFFSRFRSRWLVRHERNTVAKDTLKYRMIEFLDWLRRDGKELCKLSISLGNWNAESVLKKIMQEATMPKLKKINFGIHSQHASRKRKAQNKASAFKRCRTLVGHDGLDQSMESAGTSQANAYTFQSIRQTYNSG